MVEKRIGTDIDDHKGTMARHSDVGNVAKRRFRLAQGSAKRTEVLLTQ